MPVSTDSFAPPWLQKLSAFFANHAWLSLFTMLLLLGLAGGLAKYTARFVPPSGAAFSAATGARSLGGATAGAACGQVLVLLEGGATVKQVSQLLQSVDAVVVYGPNENGAFELRVPAVDARRIAQALETSPAVRLASVQSDCL
jgi:hypothetical protein